MRSGWRRLASRPWREHRRGSSGTERCLYLLARLGLRIWHCRFDDQQGKSVDDLRIGGSMLSFEMLGCLTDAKGDRFSAAVD